MHWVDWSILVSFVGMLFWVVLRCNRYLKSAADFLAANRCAGRYLLSISAGVSELGAVAIIGAFEMYYVAGFTPAWWLIARWPVGMLLAMTGWIVYRYRETRVFTLSQLFESRYSKNFRVFTGALAWIAGIINYGIFPSVGAKFFMYFCGLPETFTVAGFTIGTYASLLLLIVAIGVFFAIMGGQIAITVTDFIQGWFCNLMFMGLLVFIFVFFRWEDIVETMKTAPPESSLLHPYHISQTKAYNIWYWIWGMALALYSPMAWQGSRGFACAARTPHESRMAGLVGGWRGVGYALMVMMIPAGVYVIMHHPSYAPVAGRINQTLAAIDNPALRTQMLTPATLATILPIGLMGLFAAFMAAITISSDNTHFHSWGSIFVQDIVVPLRKKTFTPAEHIFWLRASIVFVGALIYLFSYFFRQTEYLFLFLNITFSVFVSGAGVCIIGALYWKKGTTQAAWTAMIAGFALSISGLILQQVRPAFFLDRAGELLLNSQQMYLVSSLACLCLYAAVSLLTHRQDYNLDKLLHRGSYDTLGEHRTQKKKIFSWKHWGTTDEFTRGDKIIYFSLQGWQLCWVVFFLAVTAYHAFADTPIEWWAKFWLFKAGLGFAIGLIVTVWISIGGIYDLKYFFRSLSQERVNEKDDGRIVDGHNDGE
ncbi:MAG: sodium:solute symporter [Verrucomicrobiae bacterium]|nr:sodium:solute symporter [Verrucomicrobiae bacterium]